MQYQTLKFLRAGEIVEIEGIKLRMAEGEIRPGDFYVGERNQGPKLAICRRVHYGDIPERFPEEREKFPLGYPEWIVAEDPYTYSYDFWECVKVEEVA